MYIYTLTYIPIHLCTYIIQYILHTKHPTPPRLPPPTPTPRQTFEICSLNLSSDKEVSDKVFRCDDFVLPKSPAEASFTMEALDPSASMTDRSCRTLHSLETLTAHTCATPTTPTYQTHTPTTPLTQETQMFAEFARIVLEHDREASIVLVQMALATQLVAEACMRSMRGGGSVGVDQQAWDGLRG
ncbi:hypothetical protein B484DRAFT_464822 [Ochromonadaceae sp. CCMP2298]|nr:hypothetical protein B484DRAFT_464822 [Ochromonadaceae sp. CCMP2298]